MSTLALVPNKEKQKRVYKSLRSTIQIIAVKLNQLINSISHLPFTGAETSAVISEYDH